MLQQALSNGCDLWTDYISPKTIKKSNLAINNSQVTND